MSLVLSLIKPKLVNKAPLCTFRSSKSYLWGVVRDRLHILSSTPSLNVLDAACHSLITRHIFPTNWNYFGLDISRSRLTSAFSIKKSNDVLFLADLTKQLPSILLLDVVVSLNTLSHLPHECQLFALNNLISCCKSSAHFIVNASVDSNLCDITSVLLANFDNVEPVYFNSFKSVKDEESGLVSSENIQRLILANEQSVPNDASLHKGVLFFCSRGLETPHSFVEPVSLSFNPSKIHLLNRIPSVAVVEYKSDIDLFKHLLRNSHNIFVVFSSRLFQSPHIQQFLRPLDDASIPYSILDDRVEPPAGSTTYCLGLEAEWTYDEAADRIFLNRLRELPGSNIKLCFVNRRFNSPLSPSLIFTDY